MPRKDHSPASSTSRTLVAPRSRRQTQTSQLPTFPRNSVEGHLSHLKHLSYFLLLDGTIWTRWRVQCLRRWPTTTRLDSKERKQNIIWIPTAATSTPGLIYYIVEQIKSFSLKVKTGPKRSQTPPVWVHVLLSRGAWKGLDINIFLFLSLIHIWRCRRSTLCRSRWSPYH